MCYVGISTGITVGIIVVIIVVIIVTAILVIAVIMLFVYCLRKKRQRKTEIAIGYVHPCKM